MFHTEINEIDDHENGTVAATWGDENDGWRVPIGFLTPSDHRGVGKPTVDTQLRLWGAPGGCNCLHKCNFEECISSY